MSTANRRQIVEALKQLKANPTEAGICSTMYSIKFEEPDQLPYMQFFSTMSKWPKHSGHPLFPVADPKSKTAPQLQYNNALHAKTLYDATTPYGALRLELLDFLITTFETE